MAFLINSIRQKAHNFILARLVPLQTEMKKAQTLNQVNHLQTMQVLQAIAQHLSPDLVKELPQLASVGGVISGDIEVIPNYAKRLREDDVFLLSFPRSGNTWMRAICAGILYPHTTIQSLTDLDDYIPDLNTRFPDHEHYSSPRVVKSHHPYHQREGWQNEKLYGKFIYILRHPYKVMTSYYDFERFRAPHLFTTMSDFVEQVVMGGYHFGNWEQHIISWQYAAKKSESLFLRYEDLQKNTLPNIIRIAQFLGKSVDEAQAETIRQFSSQESMIEMDKKGSEVPGYEFVRRGEERQTKTKESLTDDMKAMIYAYNKAQMDAWGYLPDGSVAGDYAMKHK